MPAANGPSRSARARGGRQPLASGRHVHQPPFSGPADAAGGRARLDAWLMQLDDQLRMPVDKLSDLRREELAWRAAPGLNTAGMLLAHVAIVEAYWLNVAPFEEAGTV